MRRVEALHHRNVDPFVALIDKNSERRGSADGRLWRRQLPIWSGPDEAGEVLQFQIHERGDWSPPIAPTFTQIGNKILASALWPIQRHHRSAHYIIFTIHDLKIGGMQTFPSCRAAADFART